MSKMYKIDVKCTYLIRGAKSMQDKLNQEFGLICSLNF